MQPINYILVHVIIIKLSVPQKEKKTHNKTTEQSMKGLMKGLINWVSDLVVCILTQDLDGVFTTRCEIAALFLCCRRDSRPSKRDRNSGCLGRRNKSGSRHQGRAELFSLWITVHFHIHIFTGTFIWEIPPTPRPPNSGWMYLARQIL